MLVRNNLIILIPITLWQCPFHNCLCKVNPILRLKCDNYMCPLSKPQIFKTLRFVLIIYGMNKCCIFSWSNRGFNLILWSITDYYVNFIINTYRIFMVNFYLIRQTMELMYCSCGQFLLVILFGCTIVFQIDGLVWHPFIYWRRQKLIIGICFGLTSVDVQCIYWNQNYIMIRIFLGLIEVHI